MLKEKQGKKTTYSSFTLTKTKLRTTLRRLQWMSRKQMGYQPICQYHYSTRSRCDGLFILRGTVTGGGTGNGAGNQWTLVPNPCFKPKDFCTRVHSSRMRTGRTLTVFRWRSPPSKNWRPPAPRKFGGTPSPENLETPPVDRITDACKNITLAKTSFRPVIIYIKTQ